MVSDNGCFLNFSSWMKDVKSTFVSCLFHVLRNMLVLIWLVARWTYCHWIWECFHHRGPPKYMEYARHHHINYQFFGRSNIQIKAMVILNNFEGFSSIVHCLGWWYNDPCVAHGAHFQQLLVWVIVYFAKFVRLCRGHLTNRKCSMPWAKKVISMGPCQLLFLPNPIPSIYFV